LGNNRRIGGLAAAGATVYRTDQDGTVVLTSDCNTYSITTSGPPTLGAPATETTVLPLPATPTNPPNCDPAYPTVCIPPPPPDLDCGDIPYRKFTVQAPDPHHFDGDHDGIGCEN
jgi:hypothetical protein